LKLITINRIVATSDIQTAGPSEALYPVSRNRFIAITDKAIMQMKARTAVNDEATIRSEYAGKLWRRIALEQRRGMSESIAQKVNTAEIG